MSTKDLAFYVGLGALMTHELDAVTNHEWRVLPLLRSLPDATGHWVFVAAHVPLFAIIVALVASRDARTRTFSRTALAAFMAVHGLLHVLYMGATAYEFASMLSNALIFGGAVCGALYLALGWSDRRHA